MEWVRISTTGTAPVTAVYECVKLRAGRYIIVTYHYHDGKRWRDFAQVCG